MTSAHRSETRGLIGRETACRSSSRTAYSIPECAHQNAGKLYALCHLVSE